MDRLIHGVCKESTVSLKLQFWFGLFYFYFYILKVILCEIKSHCLELVLYYMLMMYG